jgi:hypothetical protein
MRCVFLTHRRALASIFDEAMMDFVLRQAQVMLIRNLRRGGAQDGKGFAGDTTTLSGPF